MAATVEAVRSAVGKALQPQIQTPQKRKGGFPKGVSGNPAGSTTVHQRLTKKAIRDIWKDWKLGGPDAIKRCREDHPDVYLRVVVSLLPKDLNVFVNGQITHHHAVADPQSWLQNVIDGHAQAVDTEIVPQENEESEPASD